MNKPLAIAKAKSEDKLVKLVLGEPYSQADLFDELYEVCDRVHASCDDECPVYRLNGGKAPDTYTGPDSSGCDCFKSGKAMAEFIKRRASMSQNIIYYVPTRFGLDDVVDVLKGHCEAKNIKTEVTKSPEMLELRFSVGKTAFWFTVFLHNQTALGRFLCLYPSECPKNREVVEKIANIFGGLLNKVDDEDSFELVTGELSDEDKLPVFSQERGER